MASGTVDMASGNAFDPMASWARLSERVENQGKDIVDLRSNMNTGFQSVNAALGTLSNELRNSSKTQWPVIWAAAGVCFTILGGLGLMALQPVKDTQGQMREDVRSDRESTKEALAVIAANMVTQAELKWRTDRGVEDRKRTDDAVSDLRGTQVPRLELDRVFDGYTQRFSDLQRQVDEVKTAQGSVYGQRDLLIDMRDRQTRLEREIAKAVPEH